MSKFYITTLVFLFIARLRFPPDKSIAVIIESRYGKLVLKLVRKFEKIDFKCRKILLDLNFLHNCLKENLIPTFVRFKVANHRLKDSKVYKECQIKLLKQEIREKKNRHRSLSKVMNTLKNEIRQKVNIFDFAHISSCFLVHNDKMLKASQETQAKKLHNLALQSTNDPEKVIFNFSSRVLSTTDKRLLSKGLNFAIPPKIINYGDLLTPFELLFRDVKATFNKNNMLPTIGASLRNTAYDCLNSYNPKFEQNLPLDEVNALKSLLMDESIVIQKSDKGNSVVILDKAQYTTRMKDILADTTKFRKLKISRGKDFNHIHNQELRITNELRKLLRRNVISESEFSSLVPCGSQPSILYGLSKVHKPTVDGFPKLRPILSAINTPTYNLSKYLVKILRPFTTNQLTERDSFSFAEDIRKQNPDLVMASLDVDSLFTNIPLDETIDICANLLFENKTTVNGLNMNEFKSLMTLATKESFISFNGEFYKQIDGVAMGSPLGPTLANIFLGYHEQMWLDQCPAAAKPTYYKRYVDDIFVLFANLEQLKLFVTFMNGRHTNMTFTSEEERDDSLPFLDVNVIRENNLFVTSIYRKPTFSGVYTNFDSFLPGVYKKCLVSTLLFRLVTICSNWSIIHTEITYLKTVMLKNAYPEKMVDKIVYNFLTLFNKPKQKVDTVPQKTFQIILPYLGILSSRIEKNLNRTISKYLPGCKLFLICRATTRLSSLFTFKDKIPNYLVSGVIYKFKCGGCNSTYIGKTKRHTKTRFCEHAGISPLTGKALQGQGSTAVQDHGRSCKCDIGFENFEILSKDSNNFHLLIKESLFIKRDKPDLNGQNSSTPLILF